MKSLARRIEKIESLLKLKKQTKEIRIVIYPFCEVEEPPEPPADVRDKAAWKNAWRRQGGELLGPVKEWITVKEQLEAARKAHAAEMAEGPSKDIDVNIIKIAPNPLEEIRARQRQKATKSDKKPESETRQ